MYRINSLTYHAEQQSISSQTGQVQLNPKANQLLHYMVEHPNQTLTREAILGNVWTRDFVSDHSLTQAISDLRKALAELGEEHKKIIVTRPKAGYVLEAEVSRIASGQPPRSGQPTEPSGTVLKRSKRYLGWLVAGLISLVGIGMWFFDTNEHFNPPVINPYKLAFVTFDAQESLQYLAFGLSDIINYRLNQQGHYRSSLLYEHNSKIANSAALMMSGKITLEQNVPQLTFYIFDNQRKERVFERDYSLDDQAITGVAKLILQDIENTLEAQFQDATIAKLDRQSPQDPGTLHLLHQAHYASNIITPRSLHAAIALYNEVLNREPDLEIACAEKLISASILNSIEADAISTEQLDSMYQTLMNIDDDLHAPIYFEAQAVYHYAHLPHQDIAALVRQAESVRESWLSNIIKGKLAQQQNKNYLANSAYQRAYMMKPDASTLKVIEKLFFTTHLSEFELPAE